MRPSPVQLIHLTFRKVLVEIDGDVPFDIEKLSPLDAFDFDGVTFRTSINVEALSEPDQLDRNGHVFQIAFDLLVDNETDKESKSQARSPYLLDMQAAALVRVSAGADGLGTPRDLAAVNGAALVWAAFREQLSNITARMARGAALLPSVHFLDLRTSVQDVSTSQLDNGSPEKKGRARAKKPA